MIAKLTYTLLLHSLMLLATVALAISQNTQVAGKVRYWDEDTQRQEPLVDAELQLEVSNAIQGSTYSDADGNYSFDLNFYPDNVTVRVFFRNALIDVQGILTTHSDLLQELRFTTITCDPGLPCDFHLHDFEHMDFNFPSGSMNARCAKIFTLGNIAADYSIAQG